MSSILFRDSQLTNGAKLVLCEPVKNLPDSDAEDDAEEGESEMEEGGEDEIDEEDASKNGDDQEEAAKEEDQPVNVAIVREEVVMVEVTDACVEGHLPDI